MADTRILWRPVGQRELDLVADTGWIRFPPRLTGQPIFYPVLNETYATKIARDWNTKDPASDYVRPRLALRGHGIDAIGGSA